MLISIITVSFNRAYEIGKTIQSVLSQSYPNIENWIIDGGSIDGTLPILETYEGRINYISEPDKGIYHAMNKGILNSSGEYLLFLNAGDFFNSELSLQQMIDQGEMADLIYGDIIMQENGQSENVTFPEDLSFEFFLTGYLPHPATLIKKSVFDTVGLYNEDYKIVSDWEFFLHSVCKFNSSFKHVNYPVSVFNAGGISMDSEHVKLHHKEKRDVLEKHYPRFLKDYERHNECKVQLQHLRNSRLHTFTSGILNSPLYYMLRNIFQKKRV